MTTLASRKCGPVLARPLHSRPIVSVKCSAKSRNGSSMPTASESPNWRVRDFSTGLDFFRRIEDVANAEDHHPDLHLTNYRDVTVELSTHAVGGLTDNDFIMAAKIDALKQPSD